MYAIFFLAISSSSISQIKNLTITNLYQMKYLDNSPFYSFSNGQLLTNIQLSNSIFKQFFSPVFSYDSSNQNVKITDSKFQRFIFTSLFLNQENYNDKKFTENIFLSTSTNFVNCIFQIDSANDNFISLYNVQFEFDNCQFINSTLNKFSMIDIRDCQKVIFKQSVFSSNNGNTGSKIVNVQQNQIDEIKFTSTNFSNNAVGGELITISGSILQLNNLIVYANSCSKNLVSLSFGNEITEPNIVNDVIMIKNQFSSKIIVYEFAISFESDNILVDINKVVINDGILKYSPDYYHFLLSKYQTPLTINLIDCCLSNPKEKWMNYDEFNDENSVVNDDCFDIHFKNVHYGIIGKETVELHIPNKLFIYFSDPDQE